MTEEEIKKPEEENEFKDETRIKKTNSDKPLLLFISLIVFTIFFLVIKPIVTLIEVLLIVVIYVLFKRQVHNYFHLIFKKKSYVVCHMKNPSTSFVDEFLVVPDPEKLTKVGSGHYNLSDRYAILEHKGRLHFLLEKNNTIPKHMEKDDSDEILMQVAEITAALEAKPYRYLLNPKVDWKFYIAIAGLAIAIILAIYEFQMIQQMKPLIEWLYAHPPPATPPTNPDLINPGLTPRP